MIGGKSEAIFVLSLKVPLIASLCTGIVVLLVASGFFQAGGSGWGGGLFPLFVALIPFYSFGKYQRARVKSGRFYDDRFAVSERGQTRDLRYNDISRVESASAFLAPQIQVCIYLKGRNDPLILLMNPHSKNLKTDLFSWLKSRTKDD